MAGAKRTLDEMELDLRRYELRRRGRRVKLEKKPMELLIFLVARREELVSRQEIVSKLWRSDLFIESDSNINNIVRKLRAALGDDADKPRFLETVVGKGYRFIGPVRVIGGRFRDADVSQSSAVEGQRAGTLAGTDRVSLAVLPLLLLGEIRDERGVSLGFADALVARLGNLRGVDVLPTAAVLNVPAGMAAGDAGALLGVRFVAHGAIQESKGQLRVSLEVLDLRLRSVCVTRQCDLDLDRLSDLEDDFAKRIAAALNRPLHEAGGERRARYSKDAVAYAEFVRGYRLSSAGDPALLEEAAQRLSAAVARDPGFSLAHATLSLVCATRHFEFEPGSVWLEKAEFHCGRAVELDADLPEGHVAKAFLLWGPSKNFQHLEAIRELRRALALQNNLPHAYNRLGTILAHIGLLERAREMYERGRQFHVKKAVSHSIVQVHLWDQDYAAAREQVRAWRTESPTNKYPVYFAPQLAMVAGNWREARKLLDAVAELLREDPMLASLEGVFYALTGKTEDALRCVARACANPRSFGHAHHTYYQIACTFAVLKRPCEAFPWLERSVSTGFACWPFFLKDPWLQNLRAMPEFEVLVSSLQAKYPDHLGLL